MLISCSAAAGFNSFTVSSDDMVSIVEGLKSAGHQQTVVDMMTGGGSGTSDDHGEKWDKRRGLDPPSPDPGSRRGVCKHRSYIGSVLPNWDYFFLFLFHFPPPPFFHDSLLMSDEVFHPRTCWALMYYC